MPHKNDIEFNKREKKAELKFNRLEAIQLELRKKYPSGTRTREQVDLIDDACAEAMNAWHNWKQYDSIKAKNR